MDSVDSAENLGAIRLSRFAESDTKNRGLRILEDKWSDSLIEAICAAAINERFCQTLLFNPDSAIASGFNGQQFSVTTQELLLIRSIQATSLTGFIQQLKERTVLR